MIQLLMIASGLVLGAYTSYTDLNIGIIKNKVLLIGLIIGIASNIFLIFGSNISTLNFFLSSFLGALGLSFLLYLFELVPSGDAKLLVVFSLLVPPSFYKALYPFIHSLPVFINSFVPLSVFLLVLMLIGIDRQDKIEVIKNNLSIQILGRRFLFIFSLSGIASLILGFIDLGRLFIASGFLIVGMMTLIDRIEVDEKFVYIPLFLFTLWIKRDNMLSAFYTSLFGFFLYGFLRIFIMRMANDFFTREIEIENLEEGMSPAVEVIQKDGDYRKKKERTMTIFSPIRRIGIEKGILVDKNEGLTSEEIEKLKELKEEDELEFNSLEVHKSISFAPFIFTGYLLTIVIGKGFLLFIYSLIGF